MQNDQLSILDAQLARFEKRLHRERIARQAAEKLVNDKSLEVYLQFVEAQDAKKNLELALWGSGESMWSWSESDNNFEVNSFILHAHKVKKFHQPFQAVLDSVHPDSVSAVNFAWSQVVTKVKDIIDLQFRFLVSNEYRWLRARGRAFSVKENGQLSIVGTVKDITGIKRDETSFKLLSYAFLRTRDPMLIVDHSLDIIEANQSFRNLVKRRNSDLNKRQLSDFLTISSPEIYRLLSSDISHKETELLLLSQTSIPIELTLSKFTDDDEPQKYAIVTIRDLSERKEAERKLNHLAHFDPLTNLLNRNALQTELGHLINRLTKKRFAVYFLDLDGFKAVNDTLGHEAGDQLLQSISSQLSKALSNFAMISRWGGDEFIVVYPYVIADDWNQKAQLIVDTISKQSVKVDDRVIEISGSVGVALYPEHGSDAKTLLRNADAAMYEAKSKGKNGWQLYYQGIADGILQRITLLSELRRALRHDLLSFVLQGKYDQSRGLIGGEVLCRWNSASYGAVPPDKFIPIIEKNGLENELGYAAIKAACHFVNLLHSQGIVIPISVNISPPQILHSDFVAALTRICEDYAVQHNFIELEVTETVLVLDANATAARITDLQALGFSISLDDFGTGYSALSYLMKSKFNTVKIDRSFLSDLDHDERALDLLYAIFEMCKALKTNIIVEGLETENQFEILIEMGVEQFQGFLLGRPLPIKEFIDQNQSK